MSLKFYMKKNDVSWSCAPTLFTSPMYMQKCAVVLPCDTKLSIVPLVDVVEPCCFAGTVVVNLLVIVGFRVADGLFSAEKKEQNSLR